MLDQSVALAAAVRAIGGESDLDAVWVALDEERLARVIALAPGAHHLVRAIAALCGGLPSLPDATTIADPALSDVMERLIGTSAGREELRAWAEMAPAGRGRPHAAALLDAVQRRRCAPGVAAALIGPGDDAAGLLSLPEDAAVAIRRRGQADPAAPTAWTKAMSPAERDRLIATARRSPSACASCLPWLPPDVVRAADADVSVGDALDAFAAASPTARALHAAILQRLVDDAHPAHLDALTRLACAMGSDAVWRRVQTLIRESPDDAWRVVAAAPWRDLPENVRAAILERAAPSDMISAIRAARGQGDPATTDITYGTAVAFFAALDPRVWDALDAGSQRRWRHALPGGVAHLAVRSLGLRAEILARASLDDDLVRATQRHARDETTLRAALLPVALGGVGYVDPAAAHTLIAALPLPPDPGAFFCIAGERADPEVFAPARATLRTPADLALAVMIQRCARRDERTLHAPAALQNALRGRTWDDLASMMPLLDVRAHALLMPDADTLVARLAHPDRRDALRRTLDRLATLPPEVAIPTRVALTRWTSWNVIDGAAAIADALHAHGDVLLELADALADVRMRAAVLPLPDDPKIARALRGLVKDDPPSAIHMAQALRGRSWRDALIALLHAPPHPARAVWQALDNAARRAIGAVVDVAPSDAKPLAVHDPIAALALAALRHGDADLRTAGDLGAAAAGGAADPWTDSRVRRSDARAGASRHPERTPPRADVIVHAGWRLSWEQDDRLHETGAAMPDRSPAIAAAVRAVRGESDLDALMPALANDYLARVIACAPDADHVVRAIAALCGGLTGLLDPPAGTGAAALRPDDPALHDAMAHLIGTSAGWTALRAWSAAAPAGWGAAHAAALCNAVAQGTCCAGAAAALIGPNDDAAALLRTASDAALAIRRWGQAVPARNGALSAPADPTAWMGALSEEARQRLIATVESSPFSAAFCLPWLPPNVALRTRINPSDIGDALDAFAAASPTARAQHAAVLPLLVDRAQPTHLAALTRLACVMPTDEVWSRVQALIRASPDDAWRVVAAAPRDDPLDDVRAAILERADTSNVCAAVAAARGRRDPSTVDITGETTVAFFATLDPRVWDALDAATQQRWRRALSGGVAHLAVRALGLRPEILARAGLTNGLVLAAGRHAPDAAALRTALLPVALRKIPLAAAHDVIAAMPTIPSDPGAFFGIACGRDDPSGLASADAALRSPADLALAVTLRRGASGGVTVSSACAALTDALRGRAWNDLAPIMPLLDGDARVALMPDADAIVARLAHPDRRDALRRALDRLAALPPAIAIPICVALTCRMSWETRDAAAAVATALHAHGDVFLALTDALADDDLRAALLPLPADPALARALRVLVQDDPVTARRLAHALQTHDLRTALLALLTMPLRHADAIWQAIDNATRQDIGNAIAAASPDAVPPAVPPAVRDPIAALALAALQSEREDLRNAGRAALTARRARIRAIWEHLPLEVRQTLGLIPAFADLPITPARSVIRRGRRVRRLS